MTKPLHKTCQCYNHPGQAHFLTFSCFHRQPFLIKDQSRRWFCTALTRALHLHECDLWAWVIMPEHVHLVLAPRLPEYSISQVLLSIKQPLTNAALRHVRQFAPAFLSQMQDLQPNGVTHYRFWQRGGGYDRNLRDAKEFWEKIHYAHFNPVHRGLVQRSEEWNWSSAQDYLKLRELLPVPLDRHRLPTWLG